MNKYSKNKENEVLDDTVILDPITIEKNKIQYNINFKIKENMITLSIHDNEQLPSVNYIRTLDLNEIKNYNKELFELTDSLYDFYTYIKSSSENKKCFIKKNIGKLTIIAFCEKQEVIEIDLFPGERDVDSRIKEIWEELFNIKKQVKDNNNEIEILKNENKELKKIISNMGNQNKEKNKETNELKIENKELNEKIEKQNNEINTLNYKLNHYLNKSVIMQDHERSMLYTAIENKMKKKIKKIKKLYQATIHGGDPEKFHQKCDNIPYTLVFIKSEGLRRFGGFTPIPWKAEDKGIFVKDPEKKTFVFSLDNKKVFNLKDSKRDAVYHDKLNGPCFGHGHDIGIIGNPFNEYNLYTYPDSFDYKGDNQLLSEFKGNKNVKALEYEVFQLIF